MGICKKTFISILSHSQFAIPIPVPISVNKTYTFPLPWDSYGTPENFRILLASTSYDYNHCLIQSFPVLYLNLHTPRLMNNE